MTIELDHVIVPSEAPVESAKFLTELLDLSWEDSGHFKAVYINPSRMAPQVVANNVINSIE